LVHHIVRASSRTQHRDRNAAPPRPLAEAGGWGLRVVTARKAL
jgi:hypothetical protein